MWGPGLMTCNFTSLEFTELGLGVDGTSWAASCLSFPSYVFISARGESPAALREYSRARSA